MAILKVGDKVKYTGRGSSCFHYGEEYPITRIDNDFIYLEDDEKDTNHPWNYNNFLENFSLVNPLQGSQGDGISLSLSESASKFKELTDIMYETYIKKNHDYGNSFDISMNEEGLAAARIRLGDKWLRFKKLSKGQETLVKDESIRDTLLDMANYAIMTVMWMDNQANTCKV